MALVVSSVRVIEVLRETSGVPVTSDVTSDQAPPALIETCKTSSEAMAALSVPESVWAAVFVTKSVAEDPVSAELSKEEYEEVGAVESRV